MGYKTLLLRLVDLWGDDHSTVHHLNFEQAWKKTQKNYENTGFKTESLLFSSPSNPGFSLLYTLWMTFRPSLLKVLFLRLATDLLYLLSLFTLRWAILYCERQPVFDWAGYVYSLVILGSACCRSVSQHLFRRLNRKMAVSAQAALSGALYKKALSSSICPQHPLYCPEVVTELLVDVDRVSGLVVTLPRLFCLALRAALCVGMLWTELGLALLVGAALLLFLISVHSTLERRIKLLQCSQVTIRKKSENIIKEMLNGIKALKLLAWEVFFQHRVVEAWDRELETLRILGYLRAYSMLCLICMPFLVCLSSLGTFVLMDDGNVLTPSQVFMCLCLFKLLLPSFLKLHTLSSLLKQTKQSLCRLEEFFKTEDLHNENSLSDLSQESLTSSSFLQSADRRHETEREPEQLSAHKASEGAVKQYLWAFGWHWLILCLLAQLGVCVVCVSQDGLLYVWTAEAREVRGLEEWKELRNSRLSLCILLGLLQALLVCWVAYCLSCGSLRASQCLQSELLSSVLHLPLTAHLTTDPTQLLHTFTQDMYVIEEQLPKHLHKLGSCLLEIMATVLLIIFIAPVFSLAVCPLTFLFLTVQSHFSSVQRQVRHMSSFLSPVCMKQHTGDPGSPHRCPQLCLNQWLQALNHNLQVQHNIIDIDRWASLQLDFVFAVALFLISLALLESSDSLDSGIIALALAYGFNFREVMLQYTLTFTEIASKAMAAQRIDIYTKMEKEAESTEDCRARLEWPLSGELEFTQYTTEACPISPAFRDLNFSISKGEKVGVVSREKAQTDGLISCLFRAVEASSGAILIDGVNIGNVGLQTLRSHLHLIPQVPVLFSGSLRTNVDPFARCSDAQVWQVLELCQLKEKAQQLQGQLLHPIQPNSTTHSVFSSGEKRLLCLVRALLRNAKVLLVEEPQASDYSESEHLLQQLVLTQLPECTVMWLSQNPNSVMHTDRVLVLDSGHAVEFDSPSVLLQQGALFRELQRGNV